MRVALWMSVIGLGLTGAVETVAARDREYDERRSYREYQRSARSHDRQRLTRDQREYERTRAESYDPGGSYAGYPDWARYALSPKGGNR
jgi:hypothetical protein